MVKLSLRRAIFLAAFTFLGASACESLEYRPNHQERSDDLGSCETTQGCGTREIEVIFTNPFCDECSLSEKKVLQEQSKIIKRVVSLIDSAKKTIDVAQYTFSRPKIEAALLRAKERGVNIRIAMDDGQSRDGSLARRLQDAGVNVRFVKGKEVTPERSGLMHTKFMLVDNLSLVTGSNNWSSTGTSINNENTMVVRGLAEDEIIGGFACHFEAIWGAKLEAVAGCNGDNVFFTPGSEAKLMIRESIRSAQTSIDVLMHHFTLTELVKELAKAQEAGVQVRLIVNEGDQKEVSGSKFQRLLDAGGQIHFKRVNEDAYQFMHNKLAIIDGKVLINGSGNWSGAAYFNNYENFVRYYEPQVVRQFEDMFQRLWSWSVSKEGLAAGRTGAQEQTLEQSVYFGSLHSHFYAKDGEHKLDDGRDHRLDDKDANVPVEVGRSVIESAQIAFAYAQEQGGLDFLALAPHVTDDRDSDGKDMANMSNVAFEELKKASAAFNQEQAGRFVALASMEWSTNSSGNHLGILGSQALAKVERGQFKRLYEGFLPQQEQAGDRPLLMMNHPRTFRVHQEFLTGKWDQIFGVNLLDIPNNSQRKKKFNDYGLDDYAPLKDVLPSWIEGKSIPDEGVVSETMENLRQASAPYMRLMEVTMGRGTEFGDENAKNPSLSEDDEGHVVRRTKVHKDYDYYLEHGFRIAPVANHDNHFANWGTGHSSRTGVVSQGLSKKKLLDALDRRAVFASEDQNLNMQFFVNGRTPMGSETATLDSVVTLSALIADPDYTGEYQVRVYQGTTSGVAITNVKSVVLESDGWLELELELKADATNVIYLEVFEASTNCMAWSAPIWVQSL